MKKFLLLFFAIALLTACGKKGVPMTANDIEQKYGSSIVLVKNEFYYTVNLGDLTLYFTGIDNDGELANMVTEAEEVEPTVAYGTGFFISDDGMIVTNSHVATPTIDNKAVDKSLTQIMGLLTGLFSEKVNTLSDQISELHNYWLRTPSGSEIEAAIESKRESLKEERDEYQNILNSLRMVNTSNLTVTPHSKLGIAQNNTHITSTSDFADCVTIKDDPDHDLAILQLKNKKTPQDCAYIDVTKYDPEHENAPYNSEGEYIDVDSPALGEPLYMLGYNLGPTLAITENGIKAQITEGAISQNTDDVHVMYTIPSLHGSSGSPVIDKYGNLICINFAGIDITQNFNYGIKSKHLRSLLNR